MKKQKVIIYLHVHTDYEDAAALFTASEWLSCDLCFVADGQLTADIPGSCCLVNPLIYLLPHIKKQNPALSLVVTSIVRLDIQKTAHHQDSFQMTVL